MKTFNTAYPRSLPSRSWYKSLPARILAHRLFLIIAVILAASLLAASGAHAEAKRRFLSIGTGSEAGTYYEVGAAICDAVNRDGAQRAASGAPLISVCRAVPSGGSAFNVRQVSIGAHTFGLVQSDDQYFSINGQNSEQVRPYDGLRAVFSLYHEAFQLVVRADSDIRAFQDLKGKRVNIGNPGSGTRGVMLALMEAHGLKLEAFDRATEFTPVEMPAALCAGGIDAFVVVSRFPAGSITGAADACNARIVPLNSDVERLMITNHRYFEKVIIPSGTYPTTEQDIETFGVIATLVTSERVSEQVVYEVVRALMENIEAMRDAHPALLQLNEMTMVRQGLTAPLHPGVIRYYRERGWMTP